jgi:hypothetical protein
MAAATAIPSTIVHIYVPTDAVATYKAATNWNGTNYVNKIEASN